MSRLSRSKLEGSGYATDLIKQLAPLLLSPISTSVGQRIGNYISPRGSGYKSMGMGYRSMGMGRSPSPPKRKTSYTKKKVSTKRKVSKQRKVSTQRKPLKKKGGSTRPYKKVVRRRKTSISRM